MFKGFSLIISTFLLADGWIMIKSKDDSSLSSSVADLRPMFFHVPAQVVMSFATSMVPV